MKMRKHVVISAFAGLALLGFGANSKLFAQGGTQSSLGTPHTVVGGGVDIPVGGDGGGCPPTGTCDLPLPPVDDCARKAAGSCGINNEGMGIYTCVSPGAVCTNNTGGSGTCKQVETTTDVYCSCTGGSRFSPLLNESWLFVVGGLLGLLSVAAPLVSVNRKS